MKKYVIDFGCYNDISIEIYSLYKIINEGNIRVLDG